MNRMLTSKEQGRGRCSPGGGGRRIARGRNPRLSGPLIGGADVEGDGRRRQDGTAPGALSLFRRGLCRHGAGRRAGAVKSWLSIASDGYARVRTGWAGQATRKASKPPERAW